MNVRATLARGAIRMAKAQVIVKPLAATQGRDGMEVPRCFWALIKIQRLAAPFSDDLQAAPA
jgi:hypothetical protein